jgi:hypothetical protein
MRLGAYANRASGHISGNGLRLQSTTVMRRKR